MDGPVGGRLKIFHARNIGAARPEPRRGHAGGPPRGGRRAVESPYDDVRPSRFAGGAGPALRRAGGEHPRAADLPGGAGRHRRAGAPGARRLGHRRRGGAGRGRRRHRGHRRPVHRARPRRRADPVPPRLRRLAHDPRRCWRCWPGCSTRTRCRRRDLAGVQDTLVVEVGGAAGHAAPHHAVHRHRARPRGRLRGGRRRAGRAPTPRRLVDTPARRGRPCPASPASRCPARRVRRHRGTHADAPALLGRHGLPPLRGAARPGRRAVRPPAAAQRRRCARRHRRRRGGRR